MFAHYNALDAFEPIEGVMMKTRSIAPILLLAWLPAQPVEAQGLVGLTTDCEAQASYAPGELGFGTYFDSAGVATALTSEWDSSWGLVIAEITPNPEGGTDQVTIASDQGPPDGMQRVGLWLLNFRNQTPLPEGTTLNVVVGDGAGVQPRSVAAFATCPPVPTGQGALAEDLRALGRKYNSEGAPHPGEMEAVFSFYVDEAGLVQDLRIVESSGFQPFDTEAGRVMLRAQFQPAVREGITIATWVDLAVLLEIDPSSGRAEARIGPPNVGAG